VLGLALLALGVGLVTMAETRIDSSIAAMIAGTVPLQVILLRTLARERVALATRLSVLVGLAGLALVVIPGGGGASSAVGLAIALSASISWSLGSFFAHRLPLPGDGFVATSWEMLSAGVFLLVLGLVTGEPWSMDAAGFTVQSMAAAERADLEGRHAPVREPARRDPARCAAAWRAADARGRSRRRADRRLRLRRRPAGRG
jgi:drug/metabolite transporter (DMT)-like permease